MADVDERSGGDNLFARLQHVLPKHLLSRGIHALARSRKPAVRNAVIRTVLRSYPQIDMREARQPDPFAYESFNAFFTRELRPGARTITHDPNEAACPVDGTVSQFGPTHTGKLIQAKGMDYTCDGLIGDTVSSARYADGSFACLYLAPYNYHRIHMPLDGVLRSTRYVPGHLFSVNASHRAHRALSFPFAQRWTDCAADVDRSKKRATDLRKGGNARQQIRVLRVKIFGNTGSILNTFGDCFAKGLSSAQAGAFIDCRKRMPQNIKPWRKSGRYSTPWPFKHCKNSLKSLVKDLGSIVQLAKGFKVPKPLDRGAREPVLPVIVLRSRMGCHLQRSSFDPEVLCA